MIERTFIEQGIKRIELENYLKKQLDRAGFTGLEIVKTPLVTRIVLNVTRPGLAIGKGGQNIRQLTLDIEEKYGIDNPQIEIREIKVPELNARATVDKLASLLERGYSWRSVAFRTARDIMRAGAQGVELTLSGKLTGKGGRKRKQRIAEGYMKKVGAQTVLVDYAKAAAYPKAGAIGIKLRIIRPDVVFPDKVDFEKMFTEREAEEKEKKEAEEEKAGEAEKETAKKSAKETKGEKTAGEEKAVKKDVKEKKSVGKGKKVVKEKKSAAKDKKADSGKKVVKKKAAEKSEKKKTEKVKEKEVKKEKDSEGKGGKK